jgi:hypothetical protein
VYAKRNPSQLHMTGRTYDQRRMPWPVIRRT